MQETYPVIEKVSIHSSNSFKIISCHGSRIDEVSTKCFSKRLISGVGNFSYTVSFSAIRINLTFQRLQQSSFYYDHPILLEIVINLATHPVCLETQVHIFIVTKVYIVLVKNIVQTLIEVIQVEENNSASSFHANLDLVDVSTNLNESTKT